MAAGSREAARGVRFVKLLVEGHAAAAKQKALRLHSGKRGHEKDRDFRPARSRWPGGLIVLPWEGSFRWRRERCWGGANAVEGVGAAGAEVVAASWLQVRLLDKRCVFGNVDGVRATRTGEPPMQFFTLLTHACRAPRGVKALSLF